MANSGLTCFAFDQEGIFFILIYSMIYSTLYISVVGMYAYVLCRTWEE